MSLMKPSNFQVAALDRRDLLTALGIAFVGLAVYTRVLAPDILYGDSAEFQTLAYTWGTTHPTGYPVYLALARIAGLIPINTLAWRINFASAIAAAITLAGIYLITRHFISQRGAATLASLVLLMSYTFWSQSIIAEVYTLATTFIALVILALMMWWAQPSKRRWLLLLAGLLMGLGIGVHLFVLLITPAAFLFVLWSIVFGTAEERRQWQHLMRLMLGMMAGVALFYLLFALMDAQPTPTSFYQTTVYPSRFAWGLRDSDLDTFSKRFWISISGYQWRRAMLPEEVDYRATLITFLGDYLPKQYTLPTLLLAFLGLTTALIKQRRLSLLTGSALVAAFAAGLIYHPDDKYIFYLPVYLLLAVFAGVGAGYVTQWITRIFPSALPRSIAGAAMMMVLVAVCTAPWIESRWDAVQSGRSNFIHEDYIYPVDQPDEPRRAAECALSKVREDDALLVLDWRTLYSIYYVAHVEQGRRGIVIREADPFGSGAATESLTAEISARVHNGGAVYADRDYSLLQEAYTMTDMEAGCSDFQLFKLSIDQNVEPSSS